jgi:hypothetical protein
MFNMWSLKRLELANEGIREVVETAKFKIIRRAMTV